MDYTDDSELHYCKVTGANKIVVNYYCFIYLYYLLFIIPRSSTHKRWT